MSVLRHLRTRLLLRAARRHAQESRRLWLLSEDHFRAAHARLQAVEALTERT